MRALFVLLVIISSSAGAQISGGGETEPPYGTQYHDEDYARCEVVISATGLTSDPLLKVSGTKVEIGVHAAWTMRPMPFELEHPTDPWQSAKVVSWTLTIGGENVTLPQPEQLVDEVAKTVRFASTHFTDDATLPIILKRTFKLVKQGQQGPIYSEPIEVTATANVKVYNKGLTLASKEEYWINPATQPPTGQNEFFSPQPPYPDPGYPYPNGWSPNSHRGADEALIQFPIMKHGILNPSGNKLLRESDLLTHFKQSTAFFGFTHGATTYFRSCEIDELVFTFPSSEVRGYVTSGRTVPPHNLVVMHACCTCGGSGNAQYHSGWSFDVSNIPNPIPGRAYAGFTTVVWSIGVQNHPIDLHAKLVYRKLAEGLSIFKAVEYANEKAKAKSGIGTSLNMVIRGDQFARLINVYTGQNESSNWFMVLE